MPRAEVDVDALYEVMDTRRASDGLNWREVGEVLQVSPSTFTRLSRGQRPDVDTFAAIIDWLELPVHRFVRRNGSKPARPARKKRRSDPLPEITQILQTSLPKSDARAMDRVIRAGYEGIVGRKQQH